MTSAVAPTPESAGHHHDDHPPFLAHHFETPEQQFDSGKLGMWLFLAQELLFFSGLFCLYAVYRANHPEIFLYAHQFLNTTLGAVNTAVLIFSSLTMALAVRCAQLGQQKWLIINLIITMACAFVFLGVKYFEYKHKFHEGLYWAGAFEPHFEEEGHPSATGASHGEPDEHATHGDDVSHADGEHADAAHADGEHAESVEKMETDEEIAVLTGTDPHGVIPHNAGLFFSIYYGLTGLHALHIVAGIIAIGWILRRSIKGHFGPTYYGPVDYVGLYWHLVDLIWIYLFPMLYLIR